MDSVQEVEHDDSTSTMTSPASPPGPPQLPHELVASLVLAAHARLPPSLHPGPTPAGPTWTPLAGVVLLPPPAPAPIDGADLVEEADGRRLAPLVVSLGTGSKVLPEARKSPHGDLVVDMHAEVLAVRGARRWLADELVRCAAAGADDSASEGAWLIPAEGSHGRRWRLRSGVQVWMYASDVPCACALPCG